MENDRLWELRMYHLTSFDVDEEVEILQGEELMQEQVETSRYKP